MSINEEMVKCDIGMRLENVIDDIHWTGIEIRSHVMKEDAKPKMAEEDFLSFLDDLENKLTDIKKICR